MTTYLGTVAQVSSTHKINHHRRLDYSTFLLLFLLPLFVIFLRLLNTMVLEKAALGLCFATARWKTTGNFVVRHKPSLFLDLQLLLSTQPRGGTRDSDSHKLSLLPQSGGSYWSGDGRDGKMRWREPVQPDYLSFPLPLSKLLSLKTEWSDYL